MTSRILASGIPVEELNFKPKPELEELEPSTSLSMSCATSTLGSKAPTRLTAA